MRGRRLWHLRGLGRVGYFRPTTTAGARLTENTRRLALAVGHLLPQRLAKFLGTIRTTCVQSVVPSTSRMKLRVVVAISVPPLRTGATSPHRSRIWRHHHGQRRPWTISAKPSAHPQRGRRRALRSRESTAEQNQLFASRNNAGNNDVGVY